MTQLAAPLANDSAPQAGTREIPRLSLSSITSVVLGLLLILAAALKTYALATGFALLYSSILYSACLQLALAQFEILFGVWLCSGLFPRVARLLAIACFTVFACVSLYNGFIGAPTCGCFGNLAVSPWFAVAIDFAALLALFLNSPAAQPATTIRSFAAFTALIVLAGTLATASVASYAFAQSNQYNVALLEPETWVGKRFPLLDHIEISADINHGECLVLLFHHNCPQCRSTLNHYTSLHAQSEDHASRSVAFVEMPPYASDASYKHSPYVHYFGRLTHERKWILQTPPFVRLSNGFVISEEDALFLPLTDTLIRLASLLDSLTQRK